MRSGLARPVVSTQSSAADALKTEVVRAIDSARERVFQLTNQILGAPELGYKEFATAELVARVLQDLGLPVQTQLARTGVKSCLGSDHGGPCVAVLGELDALPVPDHPHASHKTGAAHACGHHAQIGMMLAVAIGLVESGVATALAGRVAFIAAPAEESVEVEWRLGLREKGEIEFLGGKQELIRLGVFDDVDFALLTHSAALPPPAILTPGGTTNGHVVKAIRFVGRASHAGAAPFAGVNALKAAMIGLGAIDAQRETYRDDDFVRIHPIITKGGDVVNAVPADVRIETFVRARRIEALDDGSAKVDRAMKAGALAIGATVEIQTMPGYLPLLNDTQLSSLYRGNAESVVGAEHVGRSPHGAFTTDMGDLSHVVATMQGTAGGATGRSHGSDFLLDDLEAGVLCPAKTMAMTVVDLLADGAATARAIRQAFRPRFTKDEYLAYLRRTMSVERYGELSPPTP